MQTLPTLITFPNSFKYVAIKKFFYRLNHSCVKVARNLSNPLTTHYVVDPTFSRWDSARNFVFLTFDGKTSYYFYTKHDSRNKAELKKLLPSIDYKNYSFLVQEYREQLLLKNKLPSFTFKITLPEFKSNVLPVCLEQQIPLFPEQVADIYSFVVPATRPMYITSYGHYLNFTLKVKSKSHEDKIDNLQTNTDTLCSILQKHDQ